MKKFTFRLCLLGIGMYTPAAGAALVDSQPATASLWLTKTDGSVLFQQQNDSFRFTDSLKPAKQLITVEPDKKYQEIDGFGCTLTGGSAQLIQSIPEAKRAALLKELFSTEGQAIGISYLRISVGASDLDEKVFSYDDLVNQEKDLELNNFSIAPDKKALIPVLRQILAINPKLKLLASPWSAPAWMKTNNNSKGGSLKTEYYEVYARYLAKYIKAMQSAGITIDALTIQNEPLHPGNNPSMFMPAETQALFIKKHLGPLFKNEGISTKIIIYDHNCDRPDYPLDILADKDAKKYIDGSAFHLYGGELSAMTKVHNEHPDKNIYFTEQWVGGPSNFAIDFKWHLGTLLIGAIRNWSRTVLEWNLASDPNYDPHTEGGCDRCQGALTIGPEILKRDVAYYVLAHAAKFVRPGSVRIESNMIASLPNVAFKTPAGEIVVIIVNENTAPAEFSIKLGNKSAQIKLPGNSAGTVVIH